MSVGVFIIFLFLFIPLVVGFIAAARSNNSSSDFFIQGRNMGSVAAFFTVAATWWSSFAFLGSNASFYTEGPVYLTAFAWNILFGYLYYIVGKRVWYLGKKFDYVTPSDFMGDFYDNEKVRIIVGAVVTIFTIPYLQIQLTGGAYLIEVASGGVIPFWLAAFLFYAVIIVYVWVGGIRAIAWTDIIYGAILFFGLLFSGIYISNAVGGPVSMFSEMQRLHPEFLTLPGPDGTAGFSSWISLCIVTALGALMGPQLWLRMYAVKDGQLFNLMPFLIALVAVTYLGSVLISWTGVLEMPGIQNADQVLPIMVTEYMPLALGALILAGGAAAAMSTSNSQIHAVSTVITKDFYQRYNNPKASDKKLTKVSRYAILIFSIIAYFMALFVPGVLVTIGLVAFGGTAQLIVPTLGALFWKRSNANGAIFGLVGGVGITLILTFIPGLNSPLGLNPAMWGLALNIVLFIAVSLATAPRNEKVVDRFDKALTAFKNEEEGTQEANEEKAL
ncbi:sodium:solute symporter family protein [Lentibacillus amyloliquefaciens]|uniref:Sodium:proline symporter n=1 Tax=Lentibacillus amyloliquefaciens TaxID=1472767 RepID=A0A0U4FWP4_9BACI|nr:sodium:solute symporter family protein [Lentibacillus amyloliquefaciens]ALX50181.1 sodium:proline symporter [Lentibacillus amyloliquefaciens]